MMPKEIEAADVTHFLVGDRWRKVVRAGVIRGSAGSSHIRYYCCKLRGIGGVVCFPEENLPPFRVAE